MDTVDQPRRFCAVTANTEYGSKYTPAKDRQDILTETFRGSNPDIIFLQECKLEPRNLLKKYHLDEGWSASFGRDARIAWRSPLKEDSETSRTIRRGLLYNPRYECDSLLFECGVRTRVQLSVLQRNDSSFLAVSWHGPSQGYNSEKKQKVFSAFMKWIEIARAEMHSILGFKATIIGGDFNFRIEEARAALQSEDLRQLSYILPTYRVSQRRKRNCVDYFIISNVPTEKLTATGIDLESQDVLESLIGDKEKVQKFLKSFPPVDHDPVYLGIQSIPVKVSERELMKMKKIYPYCSLCEYLIFYEPEKRQPEEETEDSLESIAIALQQLDLDEEEQDGNG
eukprot:m.20766 g.20766  ORF g.20766 m.20766 type:complete len:340 (+) comp28079_c0_seq2:117-1136(+)